MPCRAVPSACGRRRARGTAPMSNAPVIGRRTRRGRRYGRFPRPAARPLGDRSPAAPPSRLYSRLLFETGAGHGRRRGMIVAGGPKEGGPGGAPGFVVPADRDRVPGVARRRSLARARSRLAIVVRAPQPRARAGTLAATRRRSDAPRSRGIARVLVRGRFGSRHRTAAQPASMARSRRNQELPARRRRGKNPRTPLHPSLAALRCVDDDDSRSARCRSHAPRRGSGQLGGPHAP